MKRLLALAVASSMAACTSGTTTSSSGSASPAAEPPRGGTLHLPWSPPPPVWWDPTSYMIGVHYEFFRCCLLRTLYSYDGHPAEEGGTIVRPDLADGMPDVSPDGLTWTIRLREGIRYAPPYDDREIVAADVVEALERLAHLERRSRARPDLVGRRVPFQGLAQYFSPIEGFDAVVEGDATSITGLRTPDVHTLEIRLTRPAGDLPDRLASAAAAPIPPGSADRHDGDFIRFLPASGPYMLRGAEALDPSLPPAEQEPAAGWTGRSATLVRNPSWDPSTDPLRAAYVDRIRFFGWSGSFLELAKEGRIDTTGSVDPAMVRGVERGTIDGRIVSARENTLYHIAMNLAVPPFDDVHVRRAVNLAVDRDAFRAYAFETQNRRLSPVWHVVPATLQGDAIPQTWRPTWAAGTPDTGDVDAARREMALSAYDDDGDGRCDGDACVVRTFGYVYSHKEVPLVPGALRSIGIRLIVRFVSTPRWARLSHDPKTRMPLHLLEPWAADYPNASTTFVPQFWGPSITPGNNLNFSLLGATSEQLDAWGYEVTDVPSIDDRIDRCMEKTGAEQTTCWTELDTYLSEEIVPWIPIGTYDQTRFLSGRVVAYSFDQAFGYPSYDRIALAPEGDDAP